MIKEIIPDYELIVFNQSGLQSDKIYAYLLYYGKYLFDFMLFKYDGTIIQRDSYVDNPPQNLRASERKVIMYEMDRPEEINKVLMVRELTK